VDIGATATVLAAKLRQAGYVPVPVELTGLEKRCGSVKCCIAELRP
jgi:N-dimethylarginine dimethylaminohydrolase